MTWGKLDVAQDPVLVVGFRDQHRRLEAFRITVDRTLHPDLLRVANDTIARIQGLTQVAYSPYVDLQDGEYLSIASAELSARAARTNDSGGATEAQETAAIVDTVQRANVLPEMGAGALIERVDKGFYLQAICLQSGQEQYGFVTKATSRQVMRRSAIPLGRDDPNDRLKRIKRPELVLEAEVHVVVRGDELAILNRTQFQFLVSDSALVSRYVPAQVQQIATRFKARGITLSAAGSAAIQAAAMTSIHVAKRLDAFTKRVEEVDIDLITSGAGFTSQDLEGADFLNSAGEIDCSPDRAIELLDALEGRFFHDAFSAEKRRADRFRRR